MGAKRSQFAMERSWLTPLTLAFALSAAGSLQAAPPENPSDGQSFRSDAGIEFWDARQTAWVSLESFWLSYATASEGRFWGRSKDYPPYDAVSEHDTFMVELAEGPCLMYFFHSRWRRAQDVRRWDPVINELEGCPYVFD